jgi:hypothetical protein
MSEVLQNTKKFYKLTTKDNFHNDFQYKEGVNICLNWDPSTKCNNGLYFTDSIHWHKWLHYSDKHMYWIWDCIPDDQFIEHFPGKYKAQKIILSNPRKIKEFVQSFGDEFEIAKVHPQFLKYIDNPSDALIRHIIINNTIPDADTLMVFIKEPSSTIQLEYIEKYGPESIKYIKNPTNEAIAKCNEIRAYLSPLEDKYKQLEYINKSNGKDIIHIKKLHPSLRQIILDKYPRYVNYISDKLDAATLLDALNNYDTVCKYINNDTLRPYLTDEFLNKLNKNALKHLIVSPRLFRETKFKLLEYYK